MGRTDRGWGLFAGLVAPNPALQVTFTRWALLDDGCLGSVAQTAISPDKRLAWLGDNLTLAGASHCWTPVHSISPASRCA